jgi:hypothetical protein
MQSALTPGDRREGQADRAVLVEEEQAPRGEFLDSLPADPLRHAGLAGDRRHRPRPFVAGQIDGRDRVGERIGPTGKTGPAVLDLEQAGNGAGGSSELKVTLNNADVLTTTFGTDPTRTWHEIVDDGVLKASDNVLTITRNDGDGSLTISDVLVMYQHEM